MICYLFAAASRTMRQVLVDHARRRRARKRDGDRIRVPLDRALAGFEERGLDVIALHEALERLTQEHPRQAQVVDLRYFGGLSVPEVAATLGVSDTTVEADWQFARAWLRGRLGGSGQ
ncbi:ECF-type sigma factor [Tautonia plasticadhaerens]|uniref:RNA polymerase sigma factor SigL n=1 Tax=Tautonia plasticadhaerens TaxID=2527974 RepID=A0A518HEV3_9BACT|nr:ECF-type sigma factor [Tautonia plasticadhaerens]QDV39373.1 RNA polymerase sigma factor SigL [Tautonia plasticadhaerens]